MDHPIQEVVELAGYTARVATMCEVFEDCSEGRYARKAVMTATKQGGNIRDKNLVTL